MKYLFDTSVLVIKAEVDVILTLNAKHFVRLGAVIAEKAQQPA
jgi:hypothetical protein